MSASAEMILTSGAVRGIGRSIAEPPAQEGFGLALADIAFDEVSPAADL